MRKKFAAMSVVRCSLTAAIGCMLVFLVADAHDSKGYFRVNTPFDGYFHSWPQLVLSGVRPFNLGLFFVRGEKESWK